MLFPDYDAECPVVSTAYVAAWYAHRVSQSIRAHESDIQSACRAIDPGCAVEFSSAYERLRHVRRKPLRSVWGQTDGATIELAAAPMRESYVIGTLLHEALHGIARHHDGTPYSEEEDHRFMKQLGEID